MCQNIGNDLPTCLACGEHSMSRLVFVRVVQGYHFLAGLASWVACAKKCKVFVRESSTSFMSSMNIPITLTITRKCSSQHQILYNNFCNFIEISSYMDACVWYFTWVYMSVVLTLLYFQHILNILEIDHFTTGAAATLWSLGSAQGTAKPVRGLGAFQEGCWWRFWIRFCIGYRALSQSKLCANKFCLDIIQKDLKLLWTCFKLVDNLSEIEGVRRSQIHEMASESSCNDVDLKLKHAGTLFAPQIHGKLYNCVGMWEPIAMCTTVGSSVVLNLKQSTSSTRQYHSYT